MIWISTPDGSNTYINRRWVEYTGMSREETSGTGWSTPYHDDDKQRAWDAWNHAVATGERYEIESRLRAADGSYRWFLMQVEPLRDASGSVVKWFGSCTDIEDMKQAEVALRESQEKFRALTDFVPQMVWMCTPDGLNVYFNQRWVDYTGMSLEESYGLGWNTPFHDDDKRAAWDAWNNAVATGKPYVVESRLRAADGTYRWFLMQGTPLRDASGSIVKWFGTCTDIEDIKQSERTLRDSEQRVAGIIASAMDAIVTVDEEQRIVLFNPAAEKMFRCREVEVLGQKVERFIPQRFQTGHSGHVRKFGEDGVTMRAMGGLDTLSAVRADGEEFQIEASISKIEASGKKLFTVIMRDVTTRKQAEARLREYQRGWKDWKR